MAKATKAVKTAAVESVPKPAAVDRWPTERVARRLITNAPYNPRKIGKKEREKLRHNLEKMGLMGGLVWNKRTGHLISGHQRIEIIDAMEGIPDYSLQVTVVDLDERDEKAQNIFLNNPDAQGEFELPKLEELLRQIDGNVESGYSQSDQIQIFGRPIAAATIEAFEKAQLDYDTSKKLMEEIKAKNVDAGADEFYCVLVFRDGKERNGVLERLGFEPARFFAAREFMEAVKRDGST